ncbi:PAS domain-containing protein [Streptomyces bauhiniae]|uniref:PAS domain-containing protein n=1 Tax=Streptomyces bauhiniae TaxID=2340725 RepID=UPI0035E140F2
MAVLLAGWAPAWLQSRAHMSGGEAAVHRNRGYQLARPVRVHPRSSIAGSPQHPSGRPIGYPGYVGANAHSEPPSGAELGRGDVRGTMVAIADGRGCIAFCSAGAGVLLGWTSQEMVGQPASSVFTSAISEALTPDAGEWLSEMVLRTRDGRSVPATVRVAQRSENAHLPGSPTRTEPRLSTSRRTAPDGRSPKAFSIPALNPTCHPLERP